MTRVINKKKFLQMSYLRTKEGFPQRWERNAEAENLLWIELIFATKLISETLKIWQSNGIELESCAKGSSSEKNDYNNKGKNHNIKSWKAASDSSQSFEKS